jgi:hypothetical protein
LCFNTASEGGQNPAAEFFCVTIPFLRIPEELDSRQLLGLTPKIEIKKEDKVRVYLSVYYRSS